MQFTVKATCLILSLASASMASALNIADDEEFDRIASRLKGDWALGSWHTALVSSRSPSFAYRRSGFAISHIQFRFDQQKGLAINEAINCFHEGMGERSVAEICPSEKSGSYLLIAGPRDECRALPRGERGDTMLYPVIGTVTFANDTSLSMTPDGYVTRNGGQHQYIKCRPALARFVNRHTIAGSYVDAQGRPYTFTEDGVATWNIVQYSYEVNLDYTLGGDDVFFLKSFDGGKILDTYGFVRSGDTLLVYNVGESESCEGSVRVGSPLMVLRKMKQGKR